MPTYQYSCTECGHFFEQFQSFSEDSLTVCPECEGRLRKVFNAVGVVFKGSGFYRTDSRAATQGSDAGSDKSSSTGGDAAKPAATGTSSTDSSSGKGTSTPSTSSSSSTTAGSAA